MINRVVPANSNGKASISSGATISNGSVYSTVVPRRSDGTFETGPIGAQAHLAFDNLEDTLRRAGSSLENLLHLTIYLTDISELDGFNSVYKARVSEPYPVRCAVGINVLAIPGMRLELTAIAATSAPSKE